MDKIAELEERIAYREQKLSIVLDEPTVIPQGSALRCGWMKLTAAAQAMNVHPQTIRRHLAHAKAFPKVSPYKKGVHWRGNSNYQINVTRWLNTTNN